MIMPITERPAEQPAPSPADAARRSLEAQIVQNPIVMLAVAVAAGAMLGWLVKRT